MTAKMSRAKARFKREQQKKLAIVFAVTFVCLFVFFSWLSSVLTPDMDNPILDNTAEEVVEVNDENGFKGRVDSRLKFLEFQDSNSETFNQDSQNREKAANDDEKESIEEELTLESAKKSLEKASKEIEQEKNKFAKLLEERESQRAKLNEDAKIEYAKQANEVATSIQTNIDDTKKVQDSSSVEKANAQAAPAPPVLPLRGKVQPTSLVKVLVGSYKTREEAKNDAERLGRTVLDETPFVKEINGRFALQAGSFKKPGMARDFAQELKEHNLYVRIIKE